MTRAILAIGVGQLVNWGVLYYAFGVLMIPLERDLGVARWVVAGAFSLALLMSAAVAPMVGRLSDRGRGPQLIRIGGFVAAALLGAWAIVPSVVTMYLAWAGLGLCMAATLYEPAFAVVARARDNAHDRLKALASVTVLGGLASTVFLPLTASLNEAWGWRVAVGTLAAIVCLSTQITSLVALRHAAPPADAAPDPWPTASGGALGRRFIPTLAVFSVTSLASAAFSTTLVPAFVDREFTPTTAAMLGGVLGLMQLPGRVLLMNGTLAVSPVTLLVASLVLQAAGLAVLAVARSLLPAAAGVGLFAAGAGLTTLIRPHFVQSVFGIARAGHLNGVVARSQQLARAAAPVLTVWLASAIGYGTVFALLGATFAVLAVTSRVVLSDV
jgi:MFS family permease